MSRVRDLHEQWSQDPDYRAAYDALGPEFALARLLIEARPSPPGRLSAPCGEGESARGRRG